jgi:hypothetical protein
VTLAALAVILLVVLLAVARSRDRARTRRLEATWSEVLSPDSGEVLDYLVLAVEEHRVGLDVLARATVARDEERLRRAIDVVEGFAPGLEEGLSAVRRMARVVGVLTPLPPVAPALWRAIQLRGFSAGAILAHALFVGAAERARLRAWILGRALRFCLSSLRGSARNTGAAREWRSVEVALHDLCAVGEEAERTYIQVVRALDAVGGLAEAS